MAPNTQGTQPSNRPGASNLADQTTTTAGTSTGVGSVAVYDQDDDVKTTTTHRPSATMADDRAPLETRSSGGSMMSWIIGAIVLIILAYFLLQIIF